MKPSKKLIEIAVSMSNRYGEKAFIGTIAFRIAMQNSKKSLRDQHINAFDYLKRLLDFTDLSEHARALIEGELAENEPFPED
jgi:hypothetical protein